MELTAEQEGAYLDRETGKSIRIHSLILDGPNKMIHVGLTSYFSNFSDKESFRSRYASERNEYKSFQKENQQ